MTPASRNRKSPSPEPSRSSDHQPREKVEKTALMLRIERAYGGRDIRDVLIDEVTSHRTDRGAMLVIGNAVRETIHPALLSIWIRRLGILDEVRKARDRRETPRYEAILTRLPKKIARSTPRYALA